MKNRIPLFYSGADAPVTQLMNRTRSVRWNNTIRFVTEQDAEALVTLGGPFYRVLAVEDIDPVLLHYFPVPLEKLRVMEDLEKGGEYLVLNGESELALRKARKLMAQARKNGELWEPPPPEPESEPEPEPEPEPESEPALDFDVDAKTIASLSVIIEGTDDPTVLKLIKDAELDGKGRKGVLRAVDARLAELNKEE